MPLDLDKMVISTLQRSLGEKSGPLVQGDGDLASQGFFCHYRLYEMAVDDNATLTQKISLAKDLKDRRDPEYAKALLCHIFPGMPKSHQLAIVRSDPIKDWFSSNPTGLWCSQDDKTFMNITVENYIWDNSQDSFSFAGSRDQIEDLIETWRGDSLEKLGKSLPTDYGSSSIVTGLPKPLDNSIGPFDWELSKNSHSLERAKVENMKVQQKDEDFLQNSLRDNCIKDSQEERYQDNYEGLEGRKIEEVLGDMHLKDPEKLEEALSGMHLDSPSRAVSKQEINAESSRAHEAIIVHTQRIRNMQCQFAAKVHAHQSGNALMSACRKVELERLWYRRSARLAYNAGYRPYNPPRKVDTRIGKQEKLSQIEKNASRKLRRELNCDRDVHQLRLNSDLQLSNKRMARLCSRLEDVLRTGAKVPWTTEEMKELLRIANTQLGKNSNRRRKKMDARKRSRAQHKATSDENMGMELLDNERETECMDI
ncbi:hypothetical protein MMC07_008516, partial [Pseudocyphellaria aurata]|nr:hypothetical protein [Pseudocyphellaria aurata]